MKKTKAELSRIARKAVETRRKNIEHAKSKKAGLKARKETMEPSEYGYIDELGKTQMIKNDRIFHHEGIPDLMLITKEGKLRFYEIKPKIGQLDRRKLNPRQKETIKRLLKLEQVEEVCLVRYEKRGKKISYEPPIRLTLSNIGKYA